MALVLTKNEFQRFQYIFDFTFSFFQALIKRWVNNKLNVIRVIFTSYFLLYSIVHYYTHFNKTLRDHVDSNTQENFELPIPKLNNDLCLQERPGTVPNMHFLVPCQIDAVKSTFSSIQLKLSVIKNNIRLMIYTDD